MGEGRGGKKRHRYMLLVGRPERKRALGRPKRRWVDKIKIDLGETGGVVWIGLVRLWIGTSGGLL
jgi:hypothetical protein